MSAGCGTQTAALAVGGYPSSAGPTESWNGRLDRGWII